MTDEDLIKSIFYPLIADVILKDEDLRPVSWEFRHINHLPMYMGKVTDDFYEVAVGEGGKTLAEAKRYANKRFLSFIELMINTDALRALASAGAEKIVAAAIQYDGITFSLPQPARHGQVMHSVEAAGCLNPDAMAHACQGFITSEGRFVNRQEARYIAHKAGQNPKTTGSSRDLYSEDLW